MTSIFDRVTSQAAAIKTLEVRVQELTDENVRLKAQVDGSKLEEYRRTNEALVSSLQKVADSRSKYAKEARSLLGQ